jgi:hypothetical protein
LQDAGLTSVILEGRVIRVQVFANVTFVRRRIKSFDKRTGRYRKRGQLIIDDQYMTVKGRRILPLLSRAVLAVIFFVLSSYLVSQFTDKVLHLPFDEQIIMIRAGVDALLVILSFYLVENVILAREDFTVELNSINRFTAYPQSVVAISINDLPRCSPLMFRSESRAEVIRILRHKIPGKEFLPKKKLSG